MTRDDLRGPAWRRLFRDIYIEATVNVSHLHRCHAAAQYLLPPGAAIAGGSAAWLYGVRLAGDSDPVEVLIPRTTRLGPIAGIAVHVASPGADDIRVVDGVPRTSPSRTCWDIANWHTLADAVAYLDRMVARRLVTVAALQTYARARKGKRGWRKLSRATTLVDPAAESPQESRLRVRLVESGLPKPVSQYVIERGGQFIGRVDLAWPELRIAIEYDGRWHGHADQLHADRARLNQLVTTDGWVILHVTARRLREDFNGFLAEVRAAMRAQRARLSASSQARTSSRARSRA